MTKLNLRWILFVFFCCQIAGADTSDLMSLQEMRTNLEKISEKIEQTKLHIEEARDAKFLPDLYFMLADLYTKQSRFQYMIKTQENEGTPLGELDFTAETRPKYKAIEVYDTLVTKFPSHLQLDKAYYYKAHELRELGKLSDAIPVYEQLVRDFPTSSFWGESLMIIGNFYFAQQKIDEALKRFLKITQKTGDPYESNAYERIGWCYINQKKFEKSLLAFEKVFSSYQDGVTAQDVRKDALGAMVWPYSEVKVKRLKQLGQQRHESIAYFQNLAPDLLSYRQALTKLGRRLVVKHRFHVATQVWYEVLRLTQQTEQRLEIIEQLYVSMKNTRTNWPVIGFVEEIVKTAEEVRLNHEFEKNRKKTLHDFEIFARDVATRTHKRAKMTNKREDYWWAAKDYEAYLSIDWNKKFNEKMHLNLAEVYFNLKEGTLAGRHYEAVAEINKSKKTQKLMLQSAIEAYILSLKSIASISPLVKAEARSGLRFVGKKFIAQYPKDKLVADIRFNIAQSFYDERMFDEALEEFELLVKQHPKHKQIALAVNLSLDIFNQREDFQELIKFGNTIIKNSRISNRQLKSSVRQTLNQAQLRLVEEKSGGIQTADYSKRMLRLAASHKGSKLGEQALFEAFVSLQSKRDPQVFSVGEDLVVNHPKSKYAREVLVQLGRIALTTADYQKASMYFELFHERYSSDAEAAKLLHVAANLREQMGDYTFAAKNYQKVGDWPQVAKMNYYSKDWVALRRSAEKVSGGLGEYYKGIAEYHLRGMVSANKFFAAATQASANSPDEKDALAHSMYLAATTDIQSFRDEPSGGGNISEVVSRKVQHLNNASEKLNQVLKTGNGLWIIAALYSLGKLNMEFSQFLENSSVPKQLNASQRSEYKSALEVQVRQFEKTGREFFFQCRTSAEKFEIFSDFALGCASLGRKSVAEVSFDIPLIRVKNKAPSGASQIRIQLYDNPRDVNLLAQLAREYARAKDYAQARLILTRALEIEPSNSSLMAEIGNMQMFLGDLVGAKNWFQKSLDNDKANSTALWGLAGLSNRFGFKDKLKVLKERAARAGTPRGVVHPYVRDIF